VVAWNGPDPLKRCLAALVPLLHPGIDEIVVVRNFGQNPLPPGVVEIGLGPEATVPHMRATGFAASSGEIVAFIEDHVRPLPGWREGLLRAFEPNVGAVGGPVELAPGGRPIDWAVYFADYGRFAPPVRSGQVSALSGANMAHLRSVLAPCLVTYPEGLHEGLIESSYRHQGIAMRLEGTAPVAVECRTRAARAARMAFSQGRGYMGRRMQHRGKAPRWFRLAITPLVPLTRFGRALLAPWRAPQLRQRFIRATAWLFLLEAAWSAGEAVGAVAGVGRSDEGWR
jgi:hypothetical protein